MSGKGTGAFSPFEWLVALRYLRPRRKEGFISVIAGFSFIGIALGVMTLIVVMAVMNGFRQELFDKMLGLNGHVVVHSLDPNFGNYDDVAAKVIPYGEAQVKQVKLADWNAVAKNRSAWMEQWNRTMAR